MALLVENISEILYCVLMCEADLICAARTVTQYVLKEVCAEVRGRLGELALIDMLKDH